MDETIYGDFWSIPQFGKTKAGHLVSLGKSGQKRDAIQKLAAHYAPILSQYIAKKKIDRIGFAPHSIPRKLVFLKTFAELINLPVVQVEFIKATTHGVPVAQKSLSKLSDRIINARETLFIVDQEIDAERVLLIDDALGSGATLNEMARKAKDKGAKKVYGFAIVGSYKGFEVIPDV